VPTPKIMNGLGRFQAYYLENTDLFERLATEGQSPEVLFIGCSDSRVVPELMTGAEPGDLFITRNVGNIVPPYGTGEIGVGAVVEYAVLELHVKHAVICGHTDCGGIKALQSLPDWSREPHIARWIEHARPAQTRVEASGIAPEERHLAIVRKNVLLQMEHLRSYDAVRSGEGADTLALHGWVYHVDTGEIEAYDPASGTWSVLQPTEI
jgi:carbonic anhydrase